MLGILLIDKPAGITSHDVVNRVRRALGTRRVGHAGTLDPIATGLLVVAVGPATRFLQYLPLEPKTYIAEVLFGRSSETYDTEGELGDPREVPADLKGALDDALPAFRGLIRQVPPMFSAIKVGGKPLYKYARGGQEIAREPRTVHISEFSIARIQGELAEFRVVCSGGTYVRSLANDLGEAIGCGAVLSGLIRSDVGRFNISEAAAIDQISEARLITLEDALAPMPMVQLDEAYTHQVREGRPIGFADPPPGRLAAFKGPNGRVFSVARIEGNLLQPECVIPAGVDDGIV